MKIKNLAIKNFKSLVDFEISDVPDIVIIAGPNETGKSSVLEAILFFKENVGLYHGWTLSGSVVNIEAPFAEISISFKIFPEETEYLKSVHNIELENDLLEGWIKIGKAGNIIERKIPIELTLILSAYRIKDIPNMGIFDFSRARFSDPDEKRRQVTFSSSEKFNLPKDYLAQCVRAREVDIDNLSSGEKEILFFTELIKLNIYNSILLFDEPSIYLDQEVERKIVPLLRSMGTNNQFWMTTHSFGIMGSVEYNELFRLENYSGINQVTRAFSDEEKYDTFLSVTGEVGIVTRGERIVFLEGTEWTDKYILEKFYEEYKGRLVFVSSGSVREVIAINQKILDLLNTSSRFNFYYAIRDRDFMDSSEREQIIEKGNQRLYVWKRYHIENYLINFEVIYEVLKRNIIPCPVSSPKDVKDKMLEIIHEERERFLSLMVKYEVNKDLGRIYFDIGFPNFEEQALKKAKNLKDKSLKILEKDNMLNIIQRKKKEFEKASESGEWVKIIPARNILKLFIGKYGKGLKYEPFKNQIVHEIKAREIIPMEIKDVLNRFLQL